MTRRFSEDEDPLATLFYTAIVGCAALSLVVPFLWVTPSSVLLGLFLLLGTAGAVGHFLLIKALEIERASVLSPFGYSELLWVTLLGFLVFGQLPDRHAVIGMAIIVGGATPSAGSLAASRVRGYCTVNFSSFNT
jgi:drug/metabolite transporter (DMT)-like permease